MYFGGGIAAFDLVGTLGGATVTLQTMGADGATPVAVDASTTVTAAGLVKGVNVPAGVYRCLVAAGAPSGLYATLQASEN